MAKIFNEAARQRIISAVRKVERLQVAEDARTPRPPFRSQPTFFKLKEDIEHGSFGKAVLAGASAFDSFSYSEVDGADEVEVYNPGRKVWSSVLALCDRASLPTASAGSAMRWTIRQAWSATRISGVSDNPIAPGSVGTLRSVDGLDGWYPYDTARVYLPSAATVVQPGATVTAKLNHSLAQTPNSFFDADIQTSSSNPNPVSGEIAWQTFQASSFYASEQPNAPASNGYLYLLGGDNGTAYPLLSRTAPNDDHDLFELMGTTWAASNVGQLRCRATGWYSFSMRLVYAQNVDTASPSIPDPPISYFVQAWIRIATQTYNLIQNREITNEQTNSLTSSLLKYAFSCEFFLRVEQDDRLNIGSSVFFLDSTSPSQEISMWGYRPDKLELFIKRLG